MSNHRTIAPELKVAIAHHEAGHAVATMLGWAWVRSPILAPPLPVKYMRIIEEVPGKWGGLTYGPSVYTTQWPPSRISQQWRDAMEWQLVIDMAGGIAEAIHRGERNKRDMYWFAVFNCNIEGDLVSAEAILADMAQLTGRRHTLQRYATRACVLLRQHWGAVARVAAALVASDHLDGDAVCELVGSLEPPIPH